MAWWYIAFTLAQLVEGQLGAVHSLACSSTCEQGRPGAAVGILVWGTVLGDSFDSDKQPGQPQQVLLSPTQPRPQPRPQPSSAPIACLHGAVQGLVALRHLLLGEPVAALVNVAGVALQGRAGRGGVEGCRGAG